MDYDILIDCLRKAVSDDDEFAGMLAEIVNDNLITLKRAALDVLNDMNRCTLCGAPLISHMVNEPHDEVGAFEHYVARVCQYCDFDDKGNLV